MIRPARFPIKKVALLFVMICFGLLCAYVALVGVLSVWVGLNHNRQDGFWVPVLFGVGAVSVVSWFFSRFARLILVRIRERDMEADIPSL
jgi:hypothetical protein